MSVNLCRGNPGSSWLVVQDTLGELIEVSLNDQTASLCYKGVHFYVDRQDCPTAWTNQIQFGTLPYNMEQLKKELFAVLARKMTPSVLDHLFAEVGRAQADIAYASAKEAQRKIREALGIS